MFYTMKGASLVTRSILFVLLCGFACFVPRNMDAKPLPRVEPAKAGMDASRLAQIDAVMQKAIDDKQVSGGVVLVARRGGVVFEKAYGLRAALPEQEAATVDTIYDMASLTKSIATASAIMKLVEQGKIRLGDSVETYLPEWKPSAEEKEKLDRVARIHKLAAQRGLHLDPSFVSIADSLSSTSLKPGAKSPETIFREMLTTGQITLSGKQVDEWLDFHDADRSEVSLRNLLTHTSGLGPFDNYYAKFPGRNARKAIIADIGQRPLASPPGEKFVYSDLGYITLGEIVERVSGKDLDAFCREEIFGPLGMKDTGFNPSSDLKPRIAPTEWRIPATSGTANSGRYMIRGEVHDGNAFVQNGISGHAGLFSTVEDVAVFVQMLMNGGVYDGVRVFGPLTVQAMTHDQSHLKDGPERGYGWDVRSGYSGQRGDLFGPGFGHTGWTGTSVWAVPEEDTFIVILTNRVHPDGSGDAGPLRSKVANVVASSIVEPLAKPSATPNVH